MVPFASNEGLVICSAIAIASFSTDALVQGAAMATVSRIETTVVQRVIIHSSFVDGRLPRKRRPA
jgi:hypothetical protein